MGERANQGRCERDPGAGWGGNETIFPTRDTQIKAKDKVVVFALPKAMEQAAKLFS